MATTGLAALTQADLDRWVAEARAQTFKGHLPDYIPLLAKVNPEWVAVQVQLLDGQVWAAGEVYQPFVLMSVVKPLLLLFLLEHSGSQEVFAHVGMDPSDQSFHSLTQLRQDRGFPRNPMINSGAIALASRLPGQDGTSRCETLRQWLNQISGSQLFLDEQMLASVRSLPNEVNRAIAHLLAESGHVDSVETALDTYNQICCLSGTVNDLAKLGVVLAGDRGQETEDKQRTENETGDGVLIPAIEHSIPDTRYWMPDTRHSSPSSLSRQTVNALMLTCGLYEVSGQFAVRVGVPTKSGVSGVLLSVVPGQGAIACYSPAIDSAGNSVAGLFLLEHLNRALQLSLFN